MLRKDFLFFAPESCRTAFFISICYLFIGLVVEFSNSESKWISMTRNCVTMSRLEWLKTLFSNDVSSWHYESTYNSDWLSSNKYLRHIPCHHVFVYNFSLSPETYLTSNRNVKTVFNYTRWSIGIHYIRFSIKIG